MALGFGIRQGCRNQTARRRQHRFQREQRRNRHGPNEQRRQRCQWCQWWSYRHRRPSSEANSAALLRSGRRWGVAVSHAAESRARRTAESRRHCGPRNNAPSSRTPWSSSAVHVASRSAAPSRATWPTPQRRAGH